MFRWNNTAASTSAQRDEGNWGGKEITRTHTHGTQRRTGGIFLPLKRWFDRASCHVRVFRSVRNLAAAGLVGSVCFIDWTPDPVTVLVGITVMHLMI